MIRLVRSGALLVLLAACSEDAAPGPTDQASSTSGGTSGKSSTSSSGTIPSSSGMTGSGGTTSSGGPPLPDEVTVTAPLAAGLKATHQTSADKKTVGSLLTVKGTPSITPTPPNGAFPSLTDGKVEIVAPAPATCAAKLSFTYNVTEVAVVISGIDEVGKGTDCTKLTDAIAKDGLTVIVTDAPWSNVPAGTTAKPKVTLKFK